VQTVSRSVGIVLASLESHNCHPKQQGDGWNARCPAHEDKRASLSLGQGGDGKTLLHCFAGCTIEAIVYALGLEMSDIFEEEPTRAPALKAAPKPKDKFGFDPPQTTYDYTDLGGKLLYQVCRYKNKKFMQRRPDEKGGWVWNLRNVDRVLYELPKLTDAVRRGFVAILCEGEKDCDALNRRAQKDGAEYFATCNSGGAGKWNPAFGHYLAGARVMVVQDKDDPGRKHARQVATSLKGLAKTVRIVEAAEGKDAYDHLKAGHGVEDFVPVEEETELGEPTLKYNLSDTGNAMRFADLHQDKARFVHTWKKWMLWSGAYWRMDDTGAVQDLVKQTIDAMWEEARNGREELRKKMMGHSLSTEADRARKALLSIACAERRIAITSETLDKNEWLLNLRNGTIDLKSQEIREHRQADYLTHLLNLTYDTNAECPRWKDFLIQIMDGEEETIDFLQRAVGYSLSGSTREQVFFLLYGTGSNGKSTFLEVIRTLLGSLAQNADFNTFLHREFEAVRNDIARMRGVRFVTAVEAEGDRRFSESIIKILTGGDTVTARYLYSEPFEFKPQFKIWLAANHRPIIRGTDHAIWRRVRLIPFTVTIPAEDQDQDLAQKLQAESPGIMAWAIEGCRLWFERGLGMSEGVRDATECYRDDMDPITPFFEECCVFNEIHRIPSAHLYNAYIAWAEKNGRPKFGNIAFGNMMRDSDKDIRPLKSAGKRCWEGVALKENREEQGKSSEPYDGRAEAAGNGRSVSQEELYGD